MRRTTGALSICLALGLPAVQMLAFQARAFQAQSAGPALPADNPRLIPRTSAEREQRYLAQHRIILNVHVANASGDSYRDLAQADFTLYDNDQPRNLVSFRSVEGNAAQAHVILVLDAVNNSTKQIRYFEKEIEKYLAAGKDPLPLAMSIGVFADTHIGFTPSMRDRDALLAEFRGRTTNLHATGCIGVPEHDEKLDMTEIMKGIGMRATSSAALACLNERFVASINALRFLAKDQVNIPGRAILIWMGPGWPLLNNKEFAPDAPQLKQNFFDQLVEVSTGLREGQVTLEAIASPDQASSPDTANARGFDFFGGVASADQV